MQAPVRITGRRSAQVRSARFRRRAWLGLMLGPAGILLGAGLALPALVTIWLSLAEPANLSWVVTDSAGRQTLVNTLLWTCLVPLFSVVIGLVLALLIDRAGSVPGNASPGRVGSLDRRRVGAAWLALIALPTVVSFVGAAIAWELVFSPESPDLGIPGSAGWLRVPPWNTVALTVMMIWVLAGFAALLLTSALKSIPADVRDAARIDGARGWLLLRRITLPMISGTLALCLVVFAMLAVRTFDIVRATTDGAFGTGVLGSEFLTQATGESDTERASALAVVLLLMSTPLIAWWVRRMRTARVPR